MSAKCMSCGTDIGDGWCRACDAESDRLNRPEDDADLPTADDVRGILAGIEATDERTPLPDVAGYAELLAWIPEGFTEGPWWTAAKYDGREMGCAVIAVRTGPLPGNPTRGMVAFSSAVLNTEARRCEADARLIALAPELADALRTMPATILRYLYAEVGVRLNELGAGEPLRIAYATLRKDIRAMAERFGVELEG
jgi:hypothetical protein